MLHLNKISVRKTVHSLLIKLYKDKRICIIVMLEQGKSPTLHFLCYGPRIDTATLE